jgi:hypothetical protein
MKKSGKSRVKHTKVKKLTPADLQKVTGGSDLSGDCDPRGPGNTCLAYLVVSPGP